MCYTTYNDICCDKLNSLFGRNMEIGEKYEVSHLCERLAVVRLVQFSHISSR